MVYPQPTLTQSFVTAEFRDDRDVHLMEKDCLSIPFLWHSREIIWWTDWLAIRFNQVRKLFRMDNGRLNSLFLFDVLPIVWLKRDIKVSLMYVCWNLMMDEICCSFGNNVEQKKNRKLDRKSFSNLKLTVNKQIRSRI